MVTKCTQCGKKINITWPHLWAYKRYQGYFCTWSCLRNFDKETEGDNEMSETRRGHLKQDEIAKAVEIVLNGGNPFQYLRSIGIKSPQTSWYKIKENLKDTDPELYDKLPKYLPKEAKSGPKPAVDKGMPKKTGPDGKEYEKLELDAGGNYQLSVAETPEKPKVISKETVTVKQYDGFVPLTPGWPEKKITKPVNYGGYEVTAVRDKALGEFYYDHDHNCIDWRDGVGDEVSLGVGGWKELIEKLPEILRILGVDV